MTPWRTPMRGSSRPATRRSPHCFTPRSDPSRLGRAWSSWPPAPVRSPACVAPRMLAQDGDYIAVDISAGMLRQARAVVDPRVRLLVADGDATGLGTSSVDLLLSCLGVLRTPTRDGARPPGCCAPRPHHVDHVAQRLAEHDLIAEVQHLLGAPALPATPVDDALAEPLMPVRLTAGTRTSGLPVWSMTRVQATYSTGPRSACHRECLPDARRTPSTRCTAALRRVLNQDGQVYLDWTVSVLQAQDRQPLRRPRIRSPSGGRSASHQGGACFPTSLDVRYPSVKPPSGNGAARWARRWHRPIPARQGFPSPPTRLPPAQFEDAVPSR